MRRGRGRKACCLLVAALLLAATSLSAHDLFIKLDSYFLAPNAKVRVPLLNGTFTRSENSVTRDRVRDLSVASPSGVSHPDEPGWQDTGDTTFFDFAAAGPGTYVLGVSTRPRELTLEGKEFNQYLREEGIEGILRTRRERGELGRPARERYSKHVKAVVQVGRRRTDSFKTSLGYPAEIVPLDNPYTLRPGGSLAVQCLVDGQPVPNLVVLAGGQGGRVRLPRAQVTTDGRGVARVPVAAPGKWYVKFVHMAPVADGSVDYESKWGTLTFEVR